MKIDIVYTWVDGNDLNFIEKKRKYMFDNHFENNADIRFEDINEINYSVKSVLKFAPWVNNIFIVTDNQVPKFDDDLDLSKIKIIDHKDIIPEKYLPTFYSDVIESFIHNIPGLSEIFIYNNDDTFFLDYIYPEDIMKESNGIYRLITRNIFDINRIKKKTSEYSKRILYTYELLKTITDNNLVNNHHSKILRRSTMKIVERDFSAELDNLRRNKFRNINNIQYLFLVINFDNILYQNIIIDNPDDTIEYHFGNSDFSEKLLYKFDVTKKYKFCCLNSMNHTYKEIFEYFMKHYIN